MSYHESLGVPFGLATTTAATAAPGAPAPASPAPSSTIQKLIDARNNNPVLKVVYNPAVVMGISLAGAYHGYKRSGIGAAIGYSLLASIAPPFMAVVMLAQGFGKPKGS